MHFIFPATSISCPECPSSPCYSLFRLHLFFALNPQVLPSRGEFTDPSKALIVDAKVAAVNGGTNFRYETTTNAEGAYYLANLAPGVYRLEVEKTGFKKIIKPDVILHVQDALAIDFTMTLGAASETVTVEAGAPLLNTSDASVSTLIGNRFVENMPLNGRSFSSLIDLTPGVVLTPTNQYQQGQFSVNGQHAGCKITFWWME